MSLVLHPDPQHPEGGYAFLELPAGSLAGGSAHVSVMDAYSERWLTPSDAPGAPVAIGDANWQPEEHLFGPYDAYDHDGADWLRVGPEIVNKLDEYMPLRIAVAGQSYDVVWPENLPPRAGAAGLGGLQPVRKPEVELAGAVAVAPKPEPEPEPEPAPQPPPAPSSQMEEASVKRGNLWPLLALLVLIAAGAAAWWFWPDPQVDVAETPPTPADPPVVAEADTCGGDALKAIAGFDDLHTQLATCGTAVSPDLAFGLIEDFATREDAQALALFGVLYDADQTDQSIETQLGLTFDADPARAAEYYARAQKAGANDVSERLKNTCSILSGDTSTLSKGAYDDFCN